MPLHVHSCCVCVYVCVCVCTLLVRHSAAPGCLPCLKQMFCTVAFSSHMSGPNVQMFRVIRPFLRQPTQCKSMALGHRVLLAGEGILQGLRRWSWLGERGTQGQCSRPSGAALCPFLRPARIIWCLVCLCWLSCVSGERRRRGGRGAPRTSTRVLAID